MNKVIGLLFIIFFSFFQSLSHAHVVDEPRYYSQNPEHVVLNGNDVITYYTYHTPQQGLPQYVVEYSGAKWLFINKANMNRFKRNPEMYVPAFGGYSVWAIAHGRVVGGDPEIWKIVDGGLYLFCSEKTRDKWMLERELLNRLAGQNWPAILGQKE